MVTIMPRLSDDLGRAPRRMSNRSYNRTHQKNTEKMSLRALFETKNYKLDHFFILGVEHSHSMRKKQKITYFFNLCPKNLFLLGSLPSFELENKILNTFNNWWSENRGIAVF